MERVEFTVRPGCVQRFKPLFKLVLAEPPLSHRVMKPVGNLLPIGVRSAKRRRVLHSLLVPTPGSHLRHRLSAECSLSIGRAVTNRQSLGY